MSVIEVEQAGKFLSEQFVQVQPNIIETIYPEYWVYEGLHHYVRPGITLATEAIKTLRIDYTGRAVNYGGRATDIPLANYGLNSDDYVTYAGILGVEWTYEQLLKQEEANKSNTLNILPDVVSSYMKALEKGLRQYLHYKGLFGRYALEDANPVQGLITNNFVETITLTTDLYALTSQELYEFFLEIITAKKIQTRLTTQQLELIINSNLWSALTSSDNTLDNNVTPYMLLTDQSRGTALKSISEVNEFTSEYLEEYGVTAPGANLDFFGLFNIDEAPKETDTKVSDHLNREKLIADMLYTPPILQDDGMTYRVNGIAAASEIMYHQPVRCSFYKYPTAT